MIFVNESMNLFTIVIMELLGAIILFLIYMIIWVVVFASIAYYYG